MEKDYLNFIRAFLGESAMMRPVPTLLKPFVRKDPAIKAFIFDVYGTLLISASGDIDESIFSTDNIYRALNSAGIQVDSSVKDQAMLLAEVLEEFRQTVRDYHDKERTEELPFPEVDVLQIWEKIILTREKQNQLVLDGPLCIKCFTFVFEVLSNRIYPMPGMKELLNQLSAQSYPLGIVSNAQFYTPVIMNFFLHDTISEDEAVSPFDPDLTIFSYKYMRSKPDMFLFELLKEQCKRKYDLFADEILFIGNDMYRDIYPAFLAGFKTALFAGDTKSLRLRQEKPELKKIVPDYIITDLMQLITILN